MTEHITQTPDGLRFVRAKGGTKTHLLPQGTMKALCGYEPSSPNSWHMKSRAGWWLVRMDIAGDPAWCEKCQQARPSKGDGELS